jgi:ankyrin repeat protein
MTNPDASAKLEGLRKQAKRFLKALRAGDPEARSRMAKWLPRASPQPGLREAQQALARERGFDTWAALKEHTELQELAARQDDLLEEFLRKACLSYGNDDFPVKWQRAGRIAARFPEITTKNLLTAAVAGEVEYVRRALLAEPKLATSRGGPQNWEPLLFVCYGRLPTEKAQAGSLEVARLLLAAGADANAHFIFDGGNEAYRFTALTGAMGQGELGQPEHPRAEALARLLLEHGAEPNDSQGLYDTHLRGDSLHWLELLASYGLNHTHQANWQPQAPIAIFDYLLAQAATTGQAERARWLLAHGASPNAKSIYTAKSAYRMALIGAHREVAELLAGHGALAEPLVGVDAFEAATRASDRQAAAQLLAGHPEYLLDVEPLLQAAGAGNAACVRLLLELGMNPNGEGKHGYRALNNGCAHRAVVEALWEHGADPAARCFGATPAQWALHRGNPEMARLHAERSRSLFDAVITGHVELARTLLAEAPARSRERSPSGNTPLHELPEDPATAELLLKLLLEHGAERSATNDAGQTATELLEARGRDVVADLLESV